MSVPAALQYRVAVSKDPEIGSVVAEIPMLQIVDFGADVPEALDRIQAKLTFHLECLLEEGKPIPSEGEDQEGLYLRVKLPAHAA